MIRAIKENAYYFQELHGSILAEKLVALGYPVERTAKGWELAAINDKRLLEKFSRRTGEIEKIAADQGITDSNQKDRLGAKTRNRKNKATNQSELTKVWKSRLSEDDLARFVRPKNGAPVSRREVTVAQALDYAEGKWFERQSVVPKSRILASALKFGPGSVNQKQVLEEMARRRFIEREIDGEIKVTTPDLVVEEALMIQRVREGRGKLAPLIKGKLRILDARLSDEQREAVRHLLKSPDQVLALRGIAGSGKTTLLTEVRSQLERQGIRMVALAPSADASRGVLRKEGFHGADTIARFLVDKNLQIKARGQVLLIDEAGTIPTRDLMKILELAGESTRIILSGDTGQHAPIGRGDAMRLLETYAGLVVVTIRQIRRQEAEVYRQAVTAMSERDLKTAFAKLDEMAAIKEIRDDGRRYRQMALDYAQCLVETGIPPMVVSPTHTEARMAINAIRQHLSELGKLGPERKFLQYRELKWEAVERFRSENYSAGQVVLFHQNAPGIKRGTHLPVLEVDSNGNVWVEATGGKRVALDLARAEHFRVFEVDEISLAKRDLIRLTNGGKDLNGRRLENGTFSSIRNISKDGRITLANGMLLDDRFGHWAYGYDTSHGSQGKSAREVLCAQSSASFRAGSMEQFYVSISRGRERLKIYTDDRDELQRAVGNTARRLSALEFTGIGNDLFMNGGLSGKEWTERIAQGKAWRHDQLKSHVEKLAAQRRVDPPQGKIHSYVEYIEMRRANVTADGKHRSRGHPDAAKPKREGSKGMPDPRGNEKKPRAAAKVEGEVPVAKGKTEAKKPEAEIGKVKTSAKSAVFKHVEKAVKASGRNLSEVVGRTTRGAKALAEGAKRSIQFGNVKTTIGKLAGNPKTKEARIEQQVTRKPPTPKPPSPPAIRRGR